MIFPFIQDLITFTANHKLFAFAPRDLKAIDAIQGDRAQCVYTQSHAYIVKIPTRYYEASTTTFRLF